MDEKKSLGLDEVRRTNIKKDNKELILKGPILRTMLRLSIPMTIAYGSQTLFNFVDRFFVARLGYLEVGAIGMSFAVLGIIFAFAVGIGIGSTSIISRLIGANEEQDVKKSVVHSLYLALFLSGMLLFIGEKGLVYIYNILGASEEMMPFIISYTSITLNGSIFIFGSIIGGNILKGEGDMVSPMKAMLVGNVLNIILDPLLIFGFGPIRGYGIEGAAYATVFTRAVAFLIILHSIFKKDRIIRPALSSVRLNFGIIKGILEVGFPKILGMLIENAGFAYILFLMTPLGDAAVSAHTIALTYFQILFLVIIGFSGASVPMIGQNYGAGNRQRMNQIITNAAYLYTFICIIFSCLFFVFGGMLFTLFTKEQIVLDFGIVIFRILALGSVFLGLRLLVVGTLGALGLGKMVFYFHLVHSMVLLVPLTYFLRNYFAGYGLWVGQTLANILSATLGFIWMLALSKRVKDFVPISKRESVCFNQTISN